jgi:hypothetical protein
MWMAAAVVVARAGVLHMTRSNKDYWAGLGRVTVVPGSLRIPATPLIPSGKLGVNAVHCHHLAETAAAIKGMGAAAGLLVAM